MVSGGEAPACLDGFDEPATAPAKPMASRLVQTSNNATSRAIKPTIHRVLFGFMGWAPEMLDSAFRLNVGTVCIK
jgi:hypothetical protein